MRSTLLTQVNPAAGQGFTIAVPTGQNWLVKSARFALAASATVANRVPYFGWLLEPGDVQVWQGSTLAAVTASQTAIMSLASRTADSTQNAAAPTVFHKVSIPEIWLPGGCKIVVGALNIQAADQFSGIALAIEKRS